MKKIIKIPLIFLTTVFILFLGLAVYLLFYTSKPHIRFLINMSGLRQPVEYIKNEKNINVDGNEVSLITYKHTRKRSDRYYFLIHGLTPRTNKNEKINLFAASICDSTGMNVIIPEIKSLVEKKRDYNKIIREIELTYTATAKKYKGRYRASGFCIGATVLLIALRDVPQELHPEKMFFHGPFIDGKQLLKYYNYDKQFSPDIFVKLAFAPLVGKFTPEEKNAIHQAMMSTGEGKTDEKKIKKILGEKLFFELSVVKIDDPEFEDINAVSAYKNSNKLPKCSFFIMHAYNDNIVPYVEGKKLSKFLHEQERDVKFFGTELFSHTENNITVKGLIYELKYIIQFFHNLFEGDV